MCAVALARLPGVGERIGRLEPLLVTNFRCFGGRDELMILHAIVMRPLAGGGEENEMHENKFPGRRYHSIMNILRLMKKNRPSVCV